MNIFGADGQIRGVLKNAAGKIFGIDVPLVDESAAQAAAVSAIFTAVGQTLELPLVGFNGCSIDVFSGAAFTGFNVAFEVCVDVATNTWLPVSATPIGGGATVTSSGAVSAPAGWDIDGRGRVKVRARCTALTSGSPTIRMTPNVFAGDPSPSLGGPVTLSGTSSVQLGVGTALAGDMGIQPRATSGGLASVLRLLSSAATTNAALIKGSAGRIYKIRGYKATAGVAHLKIYNKATAPVPGTDTPVDTITLAPQLPFDIDFGSIGRYLSSGAGFALTGGVADADTTAVAAGDITGLNIWYA